MKYPQLISMPSEVSDWLEEQLEARGIDAVVYTRYILSLLHRDSADIICSYQDNQFKTYDKDLKRTRRGRKRFRRCSEWLGHSQADADQLKRSAAVECLSSATDQDCGIESLVDELCEKLKNYKNESAANAVEPPNNNVISNPPVHDVSPLDLARQYYAAFPPLSRASIRSPAGTVLALLPHCYTSPNKKRGTRRRNRSSSCGDKFLYKKEGGESKTRKYASRSNKNDLCCYGVKSSPVVFSKLFLNDVDKKVGGEKEKQMILKNNNNKLIENDYCSLDAWGDCRENEMYEDLPVDIIELLDSPSPHDDYTVEIMNLANMKEVGNKSFIHSGTNITSSIWTIDAISSSDDNNTDLCNPFDDDKFRESNPETVLGNKFSSLTMDCSLSKNLWSEMMMSEEENRMLDTTHNYSEIFFGHRTNTDPPEVKNHPWHISTTRWSEEGGEYTTGDRQQTNVLFKSLIKINHNRECSSFSEVCPKNRLANAFVANYPNHHFMKNNANEEKRDEEENLLTSDSSHFKPIDFKKEMAEGHVTLQYADGTSFVISSNLDRPNYKRSGSGYLYLESENGIPRKLKELLSREDNDAGVGDDGKKGSRQKQFILKFFVKQNDKACQTDAVELNDDDMVTIDVEMDQNTQVVPCKKRNVNESEFYFPGDQDLLSETKCLDDEKPGSNIWIFDEKLDASPDSTMGEIMWKYDDSETCIKCNKSEWGGVWILPDGGNENKKNVWQQLDKDSLRNIWKGGEVCTPCTCQNGLDGAPGKFPPVSGSQQSQLREDISQDGEQLLSDLSSLQKTYMEHLPVAEVSYDINELLLTAVNDRKRRHSPLPATTSIPTPHHHGGGGGGGGSWSIASSVLHMNSVPVLHSVTL